MKAVGDDKQAFGVPVEGPRIVEDRRREPPRPRPARALEPELRAAQGLEVVGGDGAVLVERAARLAQREDGGPFTAARPSPAGAQPARVLDREVARFARQALLASCATASVG